MQIEIHGKSEERDSASLYCDSRVGAIDSYLSSYEFSKAYLCAHTFCENLKTIYGDLPGAIYSIRSLHNKKEIKY